MAAGHLDIQPRPRVEGARADLDARVRDGERPCAGIDHTDGRAVIAHNTLLCLLAARGVEVVATHRRSRSCRLFHGDGSMRARPRVVRIATEDLHRLARRAPRPVPSEPTASAAAKTPSPSSRPSCAQEPLLALRAQQQIDDLGVPVGRDPRGSARCTRPNPWSARRSSSGIRPRGAAEAPAAAGVGRIAASILVGGGVVDHIRRGEGLLVGVEDVLGRT